MDTIYGWTVYITYCLAQAAGFLFMIAIPCIIITACINAVIKTWQTRKDLPEAEDIQRRVYSHVNDLARWCGNEFPIVEDIAYRLRDVVDGKGVTDVSHFREYLRNTYGKQYEITADTQAVDK